MAARVLVLFAREPRREARDKGLTGASGERLFTTFARGWIDAAKRCGARVVVATPPGDLPAFRRLLPVERIDSIEQRGSSLGERLEDAARRAALEGGSVVVVGGDVAPCARTLAEAFELRERAADAVVAPARDGGVSLVSLRDEDVDLLGRFVPRRSDVFARLIRSLARRRRRVEVVAVAGDVDGRRELARLLRSAALPTFELKALARAVLDEDRSHPRRLAPLPECSADVEAPVSRGPPLAA